MSWAIFGLSAGFILMLTLLLYLVILGQLRLPLKFLLVIIISGFYIVQYESLQQYTGWPSTDDLPDEFQLIASAVYEPNQKTGEKGVMYWWVKDNAKPILPPRVFELPYVAEMHEETEKVVAEQKKGGLFIGRKSASRSSSGRQEVKFEKVSKAKLFQKK